MPGVTASVACSPAVCGRRAWGYAPTDGFVWGAYADALDGFCRDWIAPESDPSVCCGLSGAVEVLHLASEVTGGEGFTDLAEAALLEAGRRPWNTSEDGPRQSFLRGTAGLGYMCLRTADPTRYRSVLMPGLDGGAVEVDSAEFVPAGLLDEVRGRRPLHYWQTTLASMTHAPEDGSLLQACLRDTAPHSTGADIRATERCVAEWEARLGDDEAGREARAILDMESERLAFEVAQPVRLSRVIDQWLRESERKPIEWSEDHAHLHSDASARSVGESVYLRVVHWGDVRLLKLGRRAGAVVTAMKDAGGCARLSVLQGASGLPAREFATIVERLLELNAVVIHPPRPRPAPAEEQARQLRPVGVSRTG